MLFTFDATYTRQNYDKELNSSFHIDPVAGVRSIRRLKELVRQYDAELFFSHDMDEYKTYKKAPDCYEG
jgi:4-pyridoxolactonase